MYNSYGPLTNNFSSCLTDFVFFFCERQFDFCGRILQLTKNDLTDILSFISYFKNILKKKIFEKFRKIFVYNQLVKTCSNLLRAASDIGQKRYFFEKKGHQNFYHPLFNPFSKCFISK